MQLMYLHVHYRKCWIPLCSHGSYVHINVAIGDMREAGKAIKGDTQSSVFTVPGKIVHCPLPTPIWAIKFDMEGIKYVITGGILLAVLISPSFSRPQANIKSDETIDSASGNNYPHYCDIIQ